MLTDGRSDRVLMPILNWLLYTHCPEYAIQAEWADLSHLPRKPKSLIEKIKCGIELYPCDLLFVHRDAENAPWDKRADEIKHALVNIEHPPAVCVIPVRMTEAWLLFDEMAIRRAAGNPNGNQTLNLPHMSEVESLPDPKQSLHSLLREASGQIGQRRRKKLPINKFIFRITQFIEDYQPLRQLAAFKKLEDEFVTLLTHGNGYPLLTPVH